MDIVGTTGTIFDSPWFAFERPAFEHIESMSDIALTWLLLIAAIVLIWIALSPKSSALFKAIVFAYIILP